MKNSFQKLMSLAFLAFVAFSCQNLQDVSPVMNQSADDNTFTAAADSDPNARKGQLAEFGAFLIGTEENPSVSSPGSGAARITQIDGNTLKFEIRVANTTGITAAHLHNAPMGVNGGVIVNLQSQTGIQNGVIAQGMIDASNLSGALAGMSISDLVKEMEDGRIYVNVHTSTNPGGELRGQVSMVQSNDNKNYGAKLDGSNEVPSAMSAGTGIAKFNFSNDGGSASFHVNVDGIADVRFAHIHFAKAGANGGVVFTLRMDKVNGPVSGLYAQGDIMPIKFSGQLLGGDLFILREAFRTGNAYVNVHSDKFPGGELRGQVN
ncbi:CHRD domain-containing protein [Algoriphagus aquimarinus]|uniref:CHRD domain-containing protein n=1 Tax=Algoriphagus aquimarinus TaxID=237018 RepID=A0A1I0ZIL2_9BACT|nr:CHRD domain-containing protein [Algoriphagus aquimarinus]SFB24043.1 CHRD domain-containing protein [Algoriphagus aquimarinus]